MSLKTKIKYRVRLKHTNGYANIHDSIGEEFNATSMIGLFYIHSSAFDSRYVPEDTYLVFDNNAVEVVEVEAGDIK